MKMTTRNKVVLIILVLAILFYASYQLIVINQLTTVQTKKNELANVQDQISQLEILPDMVPKLDEEIITMEDEKNRLKKSHFLLIQEQEEIILLVNEFLSNPNIKPSVGFSLPNNETIGNSQVSSMNISMSYEATYQELLNVLSEFWQYDRKILINQINMTAASGEILRGSFQITLYDLAQMTGELDRIFMWIENEDNIKTNPLAKAEPLVPDYERYMFIGPETETETEDNTSE